MAAESPTDAWDATKALLQNPHHRARLVAFARGRFGIPASDAEDLLQDSAIELLRHRRSVRNPEAFLLTVYRSLCVRFTAARRRIGAAGPGLWDALPSPDGAERTERRLALREALGGISSSCRRILSAYYIEGRSLGEAARSVALAASGGTKKISRCLKRLRKCLA